MPYHEPREERLPWWQLVLCFVVWFWLLPTLIAYEWFEDRRENGD
jgi:hypothetical protein